ncbi:MAG: DnaB-like helicase C-terminal domain-containing protein, partial [Solirubrobacteraceae bacterium]
EREITKWQDLASGKQSLTGTPSGFADLDEITGGFQPGNLIIIAARPSMGKSALVTNIAENVALHKSDPKPVALFSLEMAEAELAQRFIASRARIKGDDLRKGRLKEERKWKLVLDAAEDYSNGPLHMDDSSDIGILEIRAKARRLHSQMQSKYGGLGLVIVDYLQLMRPDGRVENRVEQVGQMSRGLKILARELKVPVIALSQLSRGVESRTDKRPLLSDLRECVTGDTLVLLSDGRRRPIRELVGTTPEVLAVDDFDRIQSARSDCVWSVGRRPVVRVRLASGRLLRCTADHRIRTGAGWQKAGEIKAGARVALARNLPEPANPERWSDDRVILLGQLIGDGSYLSGQPMRYCTNSEENSAVVRAAAEREFGATVKRYAGRRSWHQLLISGNGNRWHPAGVNAWLRELGIFNQRSHEKRVPEAAFRLGNDRIALLLRHLWATDGSVFVGRRSNGRLVTRVYYATNSRRLADDVAALLLRLGIVARINQQTSPDGHRPIHNVVVSGAEAQRAFLELVEPCGPRAAAAAALSAALTGVKSRPNVDTLPVETWAIVKEAMVSGGISERQMAALRGTSYGGAAHFAPSRAIIADYAAKLGDDEIATLVEDDLFWDRVVAVEPAGEEEVFDLTVPGFENWLADSVVSHNSGQIEQDADLVMFIYRDEYYNPDTTERPGEADLIIAKHRNGGLGEVPLVFQGEFTRFMTRSPEYGG